MPKYLNMRGWRGERLEHLPLVRLKKNSVSFKLSMLKLPSPVSVAAQKILPSITHGERGEGGEEKVWLAFPNLPRGFSPRPFLFQR